MGPITNPTPAVARPNYKLRCISCGARPTVDLEDADGVHRLMLCGPCTFGDKRMGDPENWNKE